MAMHPLLAAASGSSLFGPAAYVRALTGSFCAPPPPPRRYHLEIVGRRRVRMVSSAELDGYRVATVQPLSDDKEPSQGEEGAPVSGGRRGRGRRGRHQA